MKVKEISVSFKFTKNLGNYQNAVYEAGLVVEVQGGGQSGRSNRGCL